MAMLAFAGGALPRGATPTSTAPPSGAQPSAVAGGTERLGSGFVAGAAAATTLAACAAARRRERTTARASRVAVAAGREGSRIVANATSGSSTGVKELELDTAVRPLEVPDEIKDIAVAGADTKTPHWSDTPDLKVKTSKARPIEKMVWKDLHGKACIASGVLFVFELARFIVGQPPTDAECYFAAVVYALIYASRFDGIRRLEPHFRVTFYATTGWTIYYIAHLLAATSPAVFAHAVYPAGIVMLASTIYFYKHWLERMYRHFVQDRFRPYYVPGLAGLMYFHALDLIDMFNQWIDPQYWDHVPLLLPDQVWTIQDVRLTGLFMSSMALFMITLHNKGVLTGAGNTLITVLFTIFVPAFVLTGTHMNLQASFP